MKPKTNTNTVPDSISKWSKTWRPKFSKYKTLFKIKQARMRNPSIWLTQRDKNEKTRSMMAPWTEKQEKLHGLQLTNKKGLHLLQGILDLHSRSLWNSQSHGRNTNHFDQTISKLSILITDSKCVLQALANPGKHTNAAVPNTIVKLAEALIQAGTKIAYASNTGSQVIRAYQAIKERIH